VDRTRAFKVYVLPIIVYVFVWSPHLAIDIRKVESVQRKFTKRRLPGCSHLSYSDRLARLNLDSLVVRRLRQHLILTYKNYLWSYRHELRRLSRSPTVIITSGVMHINSYLLPCCYV